MMFYQVVLTTFILSLSFQTAPQRHSCESALLGFAITTISGMLPTS
jgi:hypothetical protein